MGDNGSAIGAIGVASNGVNSGYNFDIGFENKDDSSKKVAYTNSIFQGLIPPPNASAIRA